MGVCIAWSNTAFDLEDLDDTDATLNPAAIEICNDLDDNCDGRIDEGCGPGVSLPDGQGLIDLNL